jgi:hypothetical protein
MSKINATDPIGQSGENGHMIEFWSEYRTWALKNSDA